ncbi:phosphohydrolase [Macrococcoides caseolyticum]|nr:phosphohydrolase [Macrococcus caseolyticus]
MNISKINKEDIMTIQAVAEFAREIEKLKTVKRRSDTLDGRFENSAEHSWQAALIANEFAPYYPESIDISMVTRMLLVHDLGEIYAGDTWVFDDEGKADAFERERDSLSRVIARLPHASQASILSLWETFERGESHEAKYARIIDALIALINLHEVSEVNYNPYNLTKSQVMRKKQFIGEDAPEIWAYAQDLIHQCVQKGLLIDE